MVEKIEDINVLSEIYYIGVSAKHKGVEINKCPYSLSSEKGRAWLLGYDVAGELPTFNEARQRLLERNEN